MLYKHKEQSWLCKFDCEHCLIAWHVGHISSRALKVDVPLPLCVQRVGCWAER